MGDPTSREECEALLLELAMNRKLNQKDPAAFQEKVDLAWEIYGPGGQELLQKERAQKEKQKARREKARTHGPRINAQVALAGTHLPERQAAIRKVTVKEGMPVKFAREPSNVHDANAVRVLTKKGALLGLGPGTFLGYVPRDMAARMAPRMDRGIPFEGEVVGVNYSWDGEGVEVWFRVRQLAD